MHDLVNFLKVGIEAYFMLVRNCFVSWNNQKLIVYNFSYFLHLRKNNFIFKICFRKQNNFRSKKEQVVAGSNCCRRWGLRRHTVWPLRDDIASRPARIHARLGYTQWQWSLLCIATMIVATTKIAAQYYCCNANCCCIS